MTRELYESRSTIVLLSIHSVFAEPPMHAGPTIQKTRKLNGWIWKDFRSIFFWPCHRSSTHSFVVFPGL